MRKNDISGDAVHSCSDLHVLLIAAVQDCKHKIAWLLDVLSVEHGTRNSLGDASQSCTDAVPSGQHISLYALIAAANVV